MAIPVPDALKLFISKVFSCNVDRGYRLTCDNSEEISKANVQKVKSIKPVKAIDYAAMYKLKNKEFYLVGTKREPNTGNVLYVVKDSESGTSLSLSESLFKLLFEKLRD